MKKYLYIVVAALLGLAVAFAIVKQGEAKILSVNEIGTDPAAFSGTITFRGVMGGISQTDKSVVGVMDVKELQCTSANCNKILIPVKCAGTPPVFGDEVKVTGSFRVEANGGYLFVADNVKVVRHHKIGG